MAFIKDCTSVVLKKIGIFRPTLGDSMSLAGFSLVYPSSLKKLKKPLVAETSLESDRALSSKAKLPCASRSWPRVTFSGESIPLSIRGVLSLFKSYW